MNKKIYLGAILLTAVVAMSAQQLPNNSFTDWKSACGNSRSVTGKNKGSDAQRPGVEPTSWNGSNVNQTVMSVNKKESGLVTKSIESTDGSCVQLKNIWVGALGIGAVAPGYITLGTPWVYATSSVKSCDGGTFDGTEFAYRPDAVKGNFKRTDSNDESSSIVAYLWSGESSSRIGSVNRTTAYEVKANVDRPIMSKTTSTEDTYVTANATLIAKCDYTFKSTDSDWKEIIVPLEYANDNTVPTMMNVIVCAGDYWNRSNLVDATTLLVDDLDFVYYSTLSALKIAGKEIALQSGVYDYSVDGLLPTASQIAATLKGKFATAETTIDKDNKQVTIKVTNQGGRDEDGLTSHTYTIKFNYEEQSGYCFVVKNGDYSNPLVEKVPVTIEKTVTGSTCSMRIADFSFTDGGQTVNFSGVTLDGVTVAADGSLSYSGTAELSDGTSVPVTVSGGVEDEFGVYSIVFSINGYEMVFTNDERSSGVNSLAVQTAKIVGGTGSISVEGFNGDVYVYATDGRLVSKTAVAGRVDISMAKGLYVVRAAQKAVKVIVR